MRMGKMQSSNGHVIRKAIPRSPSTDRGTPELTDKQQRQKERRQPPPPPVSFRDQRLQMDVSELSPRSPELRHSPEATQYREQRQRSPYRGDDMSSDSQSTHVSTSRYYNQPARDQRWQRRLSPCKYLADHQSFLELLSLCCSI